MIIICINNNSIINNDYGRLPGVILLFKILKGTRKNFFEVYRQFGHAPSKRFACRALSHVLTGLKCTLSRSLYTL